MSARGTSNKVNSPTWLAFSFRPHQAKKHIADPHNFQIHIFKASMSVGSDADNPFVNNVRSGENFQRSIVSYFPI